MMGEEKFLFLINTARNRNRENSGQGLPETVLRVVIEKCPSLDLTDGKEPRIRILEALSKTGGIGCVTVFMINILSDIF